ncbi:TPM domain-containing protein [Lacticaseibacillus jixiensis]|uniref:TPM domain-containing protein n=1 Tax=Lacticaseibacillus jixiensis TaxID=3231926 RepID=UPI0036F2D86F
MKKRYWVGAMLALVLFFGGNRVNAAENQYVSDHANVLTDKTRQQIQTINDKTFAKLPGHPRLAVETYRHVPGDDVAAFKAKRFEQLGIGDDDWDNGLYFVLATQDHKYGLEVGYGLESALPDATKSQIVTELAKGRLQAGKYDAAMRIIVRNIAATLVQNKSAIMAPADIAAQKAAAKRHRLLMYAVVAVPLAGLVFLIGRHRRRKRKLQAALTDAHMPLFGGLPQAEQERYRHALHAPWWRAFPSDVDVYLRADFAEYIQWHLAEIVLRMRPDAPTPLFAYASVDLDEPVDTIVNAPDLPALLQQVQPAVTEQLAPYARYLPAFQAWRKNLLLQDKQDVWREFTENVHPEDQALLAEEAAQVATFEAIRRHLAGEDASNLDLAVLPVWVDRDYGTVDTTSDDHDDFGSGDGFGGGDSGGGGFDGGW